MWYYILNIESRGCSIICSLSTILALTGWQKMLLGKEGQKIVLKLYKDAAMPSMDENARIWKKYIKKQNMSKCVFYLRTVAKYLTMSTGQT